MCTMYFSHNFNLYFYVVHNLLDMQVSTTFHTKSLTELKLSMYNITQSYQKLLYSVQFTAKSIITSLTKFLVLPAYRVFHLSIVSFNLAPSTLDLTTTCFRSVHKNEIIKSFSKTPSQLGWQRSTFCIQSTNRVGFFPRTKLEQQQALARHHSAPYQVNKGSGPNFNEVTPIYTLC